MGIKDNGVLEKLYKKFEDYYKEFLKEENNTVYAAGRIKSTAVFVPFSSSILNPPKNPGVYSFIYGIAASNTGSSSKAD
ncbi:MAG: hypothetical protein N2053_03275 [Chitinispirillaceae bacterium]|nr:hypothetical protein [Chitinispirillaceae bacterium]